MKLSVSFTKVSINSRIRIDAFKKNALVEIKYKIMAKMPSTYIHLILTDIPVKEA